MSTSRNHESPVGITPADIYFVVFRHKWKILVLTLLGLTAAAVVYFFRQPPYQSQAELLIQYVSAANTLSLAGSDQKVLMPDSRGDDIINSEILILTSLDLAKQAATNFGAAKILPGGNDSNIISAAVYIRNNLKAEPATKGGSVIAVTFTHPDPQVVQPVLQEIINDYFQKHKEIHSGGQYDDVLSAEGADLSVQLNDTEQQLASLKNRASIISLDDAKKGLAAQISQVQGAILEAQAELAGYEAAAKQMGNSPSPKPESTNAPPVVPPDQVDAYNDLCARLDQLRKQERNYLVQGYTSSNSLVREVSGRIASVQKLKAGLEGKYPQIASLGNASPAADGTPAAPGLDPRAQAAQVAALQAKLSKWSAQLDQLQTQATNLNTLAPAISRLEQTRAIQQANYQSLATKLENSHIDEALDTGKTPNIKWVQMPSPPFRDWKKTQKAMLMAAFSGLLAGLAWAFLIEFYLDRSIKRPVDVQTKLHMPFFLSIPDLNHRVRPRLPAPERKQLAAGGDNHAAHGALELASPTVNHALRSHCDALRDRLVSYFESINLTRKPKLVAITSTSKGAGVSTLSAGVAASLSETGDGRVLLVDMNLENGAAQQFVGGQPGCQLDDALLSDKRDNALVQENLYVVSEGSNAGKLPRVLPKRFAALMPKLKASDYDYIIFDMPPVTQTSVTTRLAGFMDTVMLVIESEKNDRDVIQQANQLLSQSKANVTTVLNKTRKYIPGWLHHDIHADT